MKKLLLGTALLASPAFAEGELKIYHWFEYIRQELVDIFGIEPSRPLALALTKIDEAELWARYLAQQPA